jgi:hypothetical protein
MEAPGSRTSSARARQRSGLAAAVALVCALALASRTSTAQASEPGEGAGHAGPGTSESSHAEPHESEVPVPTSAAEPVIPTPSNPDTPREGEPTAEGESPATPAPAAQPQQPPRRPLLGRIAPQPDLPRRPGDPDRLQLPGLTGAWFYRPQGGGRRARVLVYLHARNADPRESCRTFHSIASRFGWLLCPIGPVDRGGGRREWRNDADYANRESIVAIEALAQRFPGRVRRHDNVVMGFSEGTYVGMNVGLMNPQTFPRWFFIAADDRYIDHEGDRIHRASATVQRVYFLTGEHDNVVEHTNRAFAMLQRAWGRRHVHMRVLDGAEHELPPDFVRTVRRVLYWVTAESGSSGHVVAQNPHP